jgi:selenide,water dikinase
VLSDISVASHPIENGDIIASWDGGEDAALWKIDEERIGILTVDLITPVADDARTWGQIAAANSISDVYAMGGNPIIALNVVGFPIKKAPLSMLKSILDGGLDKIREAGAILAGGHSVQDDEPKYGLVVYGEVNVNKKWLTRGAREADSLILTKPLGVGIITTAIKADMVEKEESMQEALHWMAKLNDLPRRLSPELWKAIHACTDVTGFGLAGHALDMLTDSDLDIEIFGDNLPTISGAQDLADSGLMPEGAYRNHIAYQELVNKPHDMIFDAQTSGGLLIAVAPEHGDSLIELCRSNGFSRTSKIGEFKHKAGNINKLRIL